MNLVLKKKFLFLIITIGVLALSIPVYIRSKIFNLSDLYSRTRSRQEAFGTIQKLKFYIDIKNQDEVNNLKQELWGQLSDDLEYATILKRKMEAAQLANILEKRIIDDNKKSYALVVKTTQNTLFGITYGGLLCFGLFAAYMVILSLASKEQNEKLKELNQLKTDFVSTVSHELRTPLTSIKGGISIILGGLAGPLSEEAKQLLLISHKNTERLIRMINEILDIAKIEARAIYLNFKQHGLTQILSHALDGFKIDAQSRKISLHHIATANSPVVFVDRDRIEQVLTNLVSNAIKFTHEGGKIEVWHTEEKNQIIIHVKDSGQGIPKEFLYKIFHKFHQVENTSNKAKEGTGLGLAIAKALIEEHKGKIWVESELGRGSCFSFSLPWDGSPTKCHEDMQLNEEKLAA